MSPKWGTREWYDWLDKFIAEAYEILARDYRPPAPRPYDPIFAKRPEHEGGKK